MSHLTMIGSFFLMYEAFCKETLDLFFKKKASVFAENGYQRHENNFER
jgi:hypothetical protein